MKRTVFYSNLPLKNLSVTDLKARLAVNRDRLRARTLVGGFLSAATLTVGLMNHQPAAAAIPLAITAVTGLWLHQNNRAIRLELAAR